MTVRELVIKLLAQDPDEIVTICGCEHFYVQNDGPFLLFDEKVIEECKGVFTSATKPTKEEEQNTFKNLIAFQDYSYVLAMVVRNELNCSFQKAYNLVRDWIDEDDNFTEFISKFFYKDENNED